MKEETTMDLQLRLAIAALALVGLAGCSGGDEPSVVSEARASTPSQFDYGWRTTESPSAVRDGTVYEYQ